MKLFTALSISAYRTLSQQKTFELEALGEGLRGLYFTEDKNYWVQQIQEQEDQEDLENYDFALLVSFEIPAELINELMSDVDVARLSPRMLEYHTALGKTSHIRPHHPNDEEVLCLLDVYESQETEDGISQAWMLQVPQEECGLWQVFNEAIYKIDCIGGIPGAMELV